MVAERPRIGHLTADLVARDNDTYLATLRDLPGVSAGPLGVVGFCMGGRIAVRAATSHPDLVAACAGFHVGGLVTEAADSPHRSLGSARAEFVFGHADNDRSMTPQNAEDLGKALAEAGLTARNEIYPDAQHGYTMADTSSWNEQACLRAFANLKDLLDRTLH